MNLTPTQQGLYTLKESIQLTDIKAKINIKKELLLLQGILDNIAIINTLIKGY